MITYGNRTVTLQHEIVSITCDICKRTSKNESWADDYYDIAKVNVNIELGEIGKYGGSETTRSFDICPKCFETHVIPFLNSLGAKETVTERDW